jgi:hypothetical protein
VLPAVGRLVRPELPTRQPATTPAPSHAAAYAAAIAPRRYVGFQSQLLGLGGMPRLSPAADIRHCFSVSEDSRKLHSASAGARLSTVKELEEGAADVTDVDMLPPLPVPTSVLEEAAQHAAGAGAHARVPAVDVVGS